MALGRCFSSGERLIYHRPDGVPYILHSPPARVVLSEEGFGIPPLQYVVDRSPFQHGDNPRNLYLGPRPVQLVVLHNFTSRGDYWDGRAALIDAIRPNRSHDLRVQGSLLYYLANGTKRKLDVLLDSGPGFAPPEAGWREWSFTEVLRFTAHNPTWYDPTQKSSVLSNASTQLVFPITFPIVFGSTTVNATATYLGTWAAYPTVVITGPVVAPSIENLTTGKKLTLATTIPSGMSVTIALAGSKSILRNDGLNLLNTLTADSDLVDFALEPDPVAAGGINQMQFFGSGADAATQVTMTWYDRYLGI